MKGVALLAGLLASTASAHMQMSKPYPIRSPLNKDSDEKKDYSYTNPLSSSGDDFPCKGYADDKFVSQATYQPGQEYEMELEGSATHEGGSCQISLSYDRGKTFKVIESMLGDCPIPKKYNFTVPSDAPTGEALLAWTWFNKIGNREMYMNCAMVTVGGSSKGKNTAAELPGKNEDACECAKNNKPKAPAPHKPEHKVDDKHAENHKPNAPAPHKAEHKVDDKHAENHKPKAPAPHKPEHKTDDKHASQMQTKEHAHEAQYHKEHGEHQNKQRDMTDSADQKKTMAFDSLPAMFVANVNQAGQCKTIEGEAVNFPMPGDNVIGTADGKGYECSGNAPFLGAGDSSGDNKNATRTNNETMSKIASAFGTPSGDSRIVSTEASTNNEFKNYVGGWSCTDGEILCSPDAWTWAMCSNGRPVFMGSVAAGMMCRFGQMVRAHW